MNQPIIGGFQQPHVCQFLGLAEILSSLMRTFMSLGSRNSLRIVLSKSFFAVSTTNDVCICFSLKALEKTVIIALSKKVSLFATNENQTCALKLQSKILEGSDIRKGSLRINLTLLQVVSSVIYLFWWISFLRGFIILTWLMQKISASAQGKFFI